MDEAQELLDHWTTNFHYYSNVCGLCQAYGEAIKLIRCDGCKMMAYCSKLHQSYDWPRHKEICPLLETLMKGTDTIHETDESWENAWAWAKHRKLSFDLITEKLKRNLSNREKKMVIFPRSCHICHETDTSKLTDCQECPDTSFCMKHPKDKEHLAKCRASRLRFEMNNALVKRQCFVCLRTNNVIPKIMDRAIGIYVYTSPAVTAIFSEKSTRVQTFLYALKKLSRSKICCMTIHIWDDVDVLFSDFFIKHFAEKDESVQELTIVTFCSDFSVKWVKYQVRNPSDCTVNVCYMQDSYANFAASKWFTKPDYVVAFNVIILNHDDLVDETWLQAFKTLVKTKCTFIMTSFSEEQSKHNQKSINSMLKKENEIFWTGKNPFSSMRPSKALDEEFYYNCSYLTIYEKLG